MRNFKDIENLYRIITASFYQMCQQYVMANKEHSTSLCWSGLRQVHSRLTGNQTRVTNTQAYYMDIIRLMMHFNSRVFYIASPCKWRYADASIFRV
jgi:Na+/phosphate symporter